ncbi:MAG TPA: VOC family protein [Chloroflexia bacterium]
MALQHISVVPVYVSDQAKAVDFYVNKLGFEKTTDLPYGESRWIQVTPPEGQTTITISPAAEYGVEPGKFTGFVFYSDDVKGTVADLKSKGVNVTEDANEQPWGVQAQFQDPDGNSFVIVGK